MAAPENLAIGPSRLGGARKIVEAIRACQLGVGKAMRLIGL